MENYKSNEDIIIEGIEPSIYIIANKFYITSKSLSSSFIEPIIVNIAFSIELYLKCLNTKTTYSSNEKNGSPIFERKLYSSTGHNLVKLFKKLKSNDQSNLSVQYLKKYNSNLIDDFEEIKDVFVDYRYSFEKDNLSINLTILNRVADFLKEYVENKIYRKVE